MCCLVQWIDKCGLRAPKGLDVFGLKDVAFLPRVATGRGVAARLVSAPKKGMPARAWHFCLGSSLGEASHFCLRSASARIVLFSGAIAHPMGARHFFLVSSENSVAFLPRIGFKKSWQGPERMHPEPHFRIHSSYHQLKIKFTRRI